MKKYILILMLVMFLSCTFIQPKLTPEQAQAEIQEIIKAIEQKPDWLEEGSVCPREFVPNSEKEVSYLDEGCQNSPKSCFEKCKREDGNACYALALLLQKRTGIESGLPNPLFSRSCKLGIISGCTNRAAFNLELESNDKNYAKCAADTFEKTCQLNDPWGCSMYGTLLTRGFGREQNFDEAIKYLDQACVRFGSQDDACKSAKEIKKQIEDNKQKKNKINSK